MDQIIFTGSALLLVFMRALQQQNVVHGYYWYAGFTSYMIALGDVSLIYNVARVGFDSLLYVGTGGAIGVTLSMWVHRKFIHKMPKVVVKINEQPCK